MTEADWLVLRKILGDIDWKDLAEALGISERQLLRYRQGEQSADKTVLLAVEGLLCRYVHQVPDRAHLRDATDSLIRRMR